MMERALYSLSMVIFTTKNRNRRKLKQMNYNFDVIIEDCKKLYNKIGSNLAELRNKSVMVT